MNEDYKTVFLQYVKSGIGGAWRRMVRVCRRKEKHMTIQSGNITVSYDADSVVWTDDAGMAHDYRGEQILEAIILNNSLRVIHKNTTGYEEKIFALSGETLASYVSCGNELFLYRENDVQSVNIPCILDVAFDEEYRCYVIGGERQNHLYIYEWNAAQTKEYELPYQGYYFQRLESTEGGKSPHCVYEIKPDAQGTPGLDFSV